MATDNPFTLGGTTEDTGPDAPRRKKLAAFGLSGGVAGVPPAPSIEEAPLYGGEISKEDTSAAETAAAPSQLATERVQRAPYTQEATPLLGTEERTGNVLTGETPENTYQPLSQGERQQRLSDFFGQVERGQSGTQQDVGGVGGPSQASQQAGQAIGYGRTANQLGTRLGKTLSDLMGGGAGQAGAFASAFPNSLSLYGSGAIGPQYGSGLTLTGQEAGGLNPADYSGAFGSGAGQGAEAASNLGGTIGQVGAGVGGALSLASLINSLVSGQTDTSQTGAIPKAGLSVLSSALPIAQSLIGPAAAGASGGLGLSGIGLAYTPLLVKSIVDMIKGPPSLPYGAGNMSQARSRAAAEEGPGQLNQYLLGQNDPRSLLALATGKVPLSPNQEIQGYAGGNQWGSDPYNQLLEGVLAGDPQATQDFLRSYEFRAGETGTLGSVASQATDTYRRQLANSLGLAPEQTQGMFGEDQFGGGLNEAFWNEVQSAPYGGAGDYGVGKLQELMDQANTYGDPNYSGNFANYSSNYRDPAAGRLSPEQVGIFQQILQEKMGQAQAEAARWQG